MPEHKKTSTLEDLKLSLISSIADALNNTIEEPPPKVNPLDVVSAERIQPQTMPRMDDSFMYNGYKLAVYSNEHPPPHFSISHGGKSSCYHLETGEYLTGSLRINKKILKRIFRDNKKKLQRLWKKTRPADDTVDLHAPPTNQAAGLNDRHAGWYHPSHFHIHINTEESIFIEAEYNNKKTLQINPKLKGTFYHEAIHFLQDLTTTSGLILICHLVDEIRLYCEKAITTGHILPNPITTYFQEGMADNQEINIWRLGSTAIFNFTKVTGSRCGYMGTNFPYFLCYTDGATNNPFFFGAKAIRECMAHLLQSKFENQTRNTYPYLTADLVARHLHPTFHLEPQTLFGLCELALLHTDPGPAFADFLNLMRKQDFKPTSPLDLPEFLKIYASETYDGLQRAFKHTSHDAENQTLNYFAADQFKTLSSDLKKIFTNARIYRERNPLFLTEIFSKKAPECEIELNDIIQRITLPIASNTAGESYINNALEQNPLILAALEQMRSIINHVQVGCRLVPLCQQNSIDMTGPNCKNNPWAQKNTSPLCPFGQLTFTWNLPTSWPIERKK